MDSNPPTDQYQDQGQPEATPKQSVVARVQQAQNVLVTVKTNPSVDEMAATIGLTLMLNKLGKHATAVFSGEVPSTLEFLRPEETIETNTDSLRDFIVSLDKSKADKLRYKVEENVVKIFITPYRTSITQEDLEFTQGDFNVDVVLALGVTLREELDQAITAHGRILHDASVITVTAGQDYSELGQINWQEPAASSLCEMLVSISEAFGGGLIDEQIATAFLTGIVAETERFSNPKTNPKVMTMSAQLMAAGANQQLIANELEKAVEPEELPVQEVSADTEAVDDEIAIANDGTLTIQHDPAETETAAESDMPAELPEVQPEAAADESVLPQPEADQQDVLPAPSETEYSPRLPKPEPAPVVDSVNPLMPASAVDAQPGVDPETEVPQETAQSMNEQAQPEAATEPEAAEQAQEAPGETEPLLPPLPAFEPPQPEAESGDIHIDTEGNMIRKSASEPKHKVIQPLPPAGETEETPPQAETEPSVNAFDSPVLSQPETPASPGPVAYNPLPPPPEMDMTPSGPIQDTTTIEQLEQSVVGDQTSGAPADGVDSARTAVMDVYSQKEFDPSDQSRADLNALPLGTPPPSTPFDSYRLSHTATETSTPHVTDVSGNLPHDFLQPSAATQATPQPEQQSTEDYAMPPPPVPPPMLPR